MATKLTREQQALLDGAQGEEKARVMKALVLYGEAFGAETMVPITGGRGHLSAGSSLSMSKPVLRLIDRLIAGGALPKQAFTVHPRPFDRSLPANPAQKLLFKGMYAAQDAYEAQLQKMGLLNADAFSCTCCMDQVGNRSEAGETLSWAGSSAVVYANSVLGARCNRNPAIIGLFGSIAGFVPCFGLLTDEGRRAAWVIEVRTAEKPEAQLLGSAIGLKVKADVPYIRGLDRWLGAELDEAACSYLKDMGAAAASSGALGLCHVENLTPEAVRLGEGVIAEGAQTYVIDDEALERVRASYPCTWAKPETKPKLCFIGCPHLSLLQLNAWTEALTRALAKRGRARVAVPTVFTAAPAVIEAFMATPAAERLEEAGVVLSAVCPLIYINNPLCGKIPVITNADKLRTRSSARFYTDAEILDIITKKGGR